MGKYSGDWDNYEQVKSDFGNPEGFATEDEIVFASYNLDGYEGSALVIYQRDGKLFEVQESHCSCNGLDYWAPEETTWEAIKMRFSKDRYLYYGVNEKDFCALLEEKAT